MKRSYLFGVFLLFVSHFLFANEYLSHQVSEHTLTVESRKGQVKINVLHELALEVQYNAEQTQLPSFAKPKNHQPADTAFRVIDKPDHLLLATKRMSARVYKSPFRIAFYRDEQLLIEEEVGFFDYQSMQGFRFRLSPGEKLMGGGERVLGMDRRGQRLPLYNRAHYGYTTESHQMNFSLPMVMSDKKYTLLFDNSANGWLDLGKTRDDILQFEAAGGRHSYMVFAGDDYPELLKSYHQVTGFQPLPPRWAFGNHASRFGYKSQQQVLDTIQKYRELQVPVDSIILDLYWFGPDIQGHMGNLDWDKKAFPEPQKMIRSLQQDGVNTVLITEPFILTSSKRWQEAVDNDVLGLQLNGKEPRTFDFYFGNTGLVDVFHQPARDWFGSIYQELRAQGVTGVWGDLGEPEVHPADMLHRVSSANGLVATGDEVHNAYGHEWASLVNDALNDVAYDERQFIIMRAGFAGSQRYGLIPWTGDVSRSWGGLKPQVELSLQMGMMGLAYTHSDLGGFAGGGEFNREMYLRWLQYGVFQPVYRPHAQDEIAPEPIFHDQTTIDISREYINLRYRLFPYNYALAYENATTGMPLMRPMMFAPEATQEWLDIADQYFWGDAFLVKPVTDPNLTEIDVMLPEGKWFDYFSLRQYEGGQTIQYPLTLQTIPVLVKAGAIIPSAPLTQSLSDYSGEEIRLDYYFSPKVAEATSVFYDDDGRSQSAIAKGKYQLFDLRARWSASTEMFSFVIEQNSAGKGYKGQPEQRRFTLVINNWQSAPKQLWLGNQKLGSEDFKFDPATKQLQVEMLIDSDSPSKAITVFQ